MLLVQDAVTAIAGDGAKRRAAVDAAFLRLLQQPFVQQDVVVLAVFVGVEPQVCSVCLVCCSLVTRSGAIAAICAGLALQ
jgi:hypothetical protein